MPDPYHEADLDDDTKDFSRALTSLKEELEAVDWYNQRIAVCTDKELESILRHNRKEEKEHASMLIEWLRRMDDEFDEALEKHLFSSGKIVKQ